MVDNIKIGFIFTTNKSTDFIKEQIINCRDTCNKIYLISNSIGVTDIPDLENDIGLLNISNKYGFGNIIEEL